MYSNYSLTNFFLVFFTKDIAVHTYPLWGLVCAPLLPTLPLFMISVRKFFLAHIGIYCVWIQD
jgi:hypothetical protein